jgi:uncharacterized protein (DUF2237 family)
MAIDIASARNVLGGPLRACSYAPITGFFRDGCCRTRRDDVGLHVVCVKVTADFLAFSAKQGNDLSTPIPDARFPGLKPGDRWCLCASRWLEAYEAGKAPLVVLESTHEQALEVIPLAALQAHALSSPKPLEE